MIRAANKPKHKGHPGEAQAKRHNGTARARVRIAILGPMNGQIGVIASKCNRRARLRVINRDRGDKLFPSCDHLILWTRFITHKWTEAAYRQFPRDRVHLHHGGLSGLIEKINKLAAASR